MIFFTSKETKILNNLTGFKILKYEDLSKYFNFSSSHLSNIRLDIIENSFQINKEIYFIEEFPLNLISKSRQGFTQENLLSLLNSILQSNNLQKINSLQEFNIEKLDKKTFQKIKEELPPIILSILPDETIKLEDGNHRVALYEYILKLENIKAIVCR